MTSSPRTGRRQLTRLQDTLSERDWDVLRVVDAHRFLTTRHVEAFVFHGHATPLSAARACRRVLGRLHAARLLARLDRRVGGVRAGSASFVWALGPLGDRLLRSPDAPRRRQHEPSVTFLQHYLAVADAHLALRAADRRGALELLRVETEPRCWRTFTGPYGASETLRPDLYVVTGDGAYEHAWFIEVDRGTESLPRLIAKCAQYETYRFAGLEQDRWGAFPLVVWSLPDQARAVKLRRAILAASGLDPALFRLTTPDELPTLLAIGGGAP